MLWAQRPVQQPKWVATSSRAVMLALSTTPEAAVWWDRTFPTLRGGVSFFSSESVGISFSIASGCHPPIHPTLTFYFSESLLIPFLPSRNSTGFCWRFPQLPRGQEGCPLRRLRTSGRGCAPHREHSLLAEISSSAEACKPRRILMAKLFPCWRNVIALGQGLF